MQDLTNAAFPIIEPSSGIGSMSLGFTKHEYATLMIAQGLVSKYILTTPEDQATIAKLSYKMAVEVLKQFP